MRGRADGRGGSNEADATVQRAPGKHSLVASRYPALGKALEGRGGEPSIHDAATAAVEHKDAGHSVDGGVADRVGAHLGADLSGVRVHHDPLAQQASAAIGARAFAYGADVFLGPGESGSDLGLMAHELTHVVQQGAAGQRALQRQVQVGEADTPAERQADQVSAEVTGGAKPTNLLVDNAPVATNQMLKSQFIAQLRALVTAAADQELGPIYSGIGCPYIDQYFGRYAGQPAAAAEALVKRFAPDARGAQNAADMIPIVVARVRVGVRQWRDTGHAPPELAAAEPGAAAAATPAPAQALRAPDGSETLASLEADLGSGTALDGTTASRMSNALGVDVSSARIHTGAVASRKAMDAGALAFTVGQHVVMASGAPGTGTLEGDALLAHELAHVAQQSGAATDAVARRKPIGGESLAAETHADTAAAAAMLQLHGSQPAGLASRLVGAFKTDLQLQRCPGEAKAPAAGTFDGVAVNAMITSGDATKRSAALAAVVAKMRGEGRDFSVVKGGAPVYDGSNPTYGETSHEKPAVITIGTAGMGADWQFLQLVVEHELVHAQQWQDPTAAEAMGREEREFLATMREFDLADNLGLKDRTRAYNLTSAQAKLTGWFTKLTPAKQKLHQAEYDRAMAMKLDP